MPSEAAQLYALFNVPMAVSFYFVFPEWSVAFGHYEISAFFVSVPEATVDEDDGAVFAQHYVGGTGQTLYVYAKAVAPCVQIAPYQQFGFCILAAYARHTIVSLFFRHSVCHKAKMLSCG